MPGKRDATFSRHEMNAIREQAIEFAGIGLCRFRFDKRIIFMDRTALRMLGLEKEYPDPSVLAGKDIESLLVRTAPPDFVRGRIVNMNFPS